MESLARLVFIILLSIFSIFFISIGIGFVIIQQKTFPNLGGWWYILWIPIHASLCYLLAIFTLILLSKIKT